MTIKRIFLLEPNLVKSSGHPLECTVSFLSFCEEKQIKVYPVGNIDIDSETHAATKALALLTNTCFQNLESNGEHFSEDLERLSAEYNLVNTDLVFVMTSYVNEILGTAQFLSNIRSNNVPHFGLYFHQLFPPTRFFSEGIEPSFQSFWMSRLSQAFAALPTKSPITLWTTPSRALNKAYSHVAKRIVKMLPYPSMHSSTQTKNLEIKNTEPLKFGFLGDGRYEKGLLILLLAIAETQDKFNAYVIQSIDLRGYTRTELSRLRKVRQKLSTWKNIRFIDHSLDVYQFQQLIQSVDVTLLPYHPLSYDRRISSIFVHSIKNGKPVLVSKGTWLEKEVLRHKTGVTFRYDVFDLSRSVASFIKAISKMELKIEYLHEMAIKASNHYTYEYSARNFFNKLMNAW